MCYADKVDMRISLVHRVSIEPFPMSWTLLKKSGGYQDFDSLFPAGYRWSGPELFFPWSLYILMYILPLRRSRNNRRRDIPGIDLIKVQLLNFFSYHSCLVQLQSCRKTLIHWDSYIVLLRSVMLSLRMSEETRFLLFFVFWPTVKTDSPNTGIGYLIEIWFAPFSGVWFSPLPWSWIFFFGVDLGVNF